MKTWIIPTCLLLLSPQAVHAQPWPSPEAVWHYGNGPDGGYTTLAYVSDTLLGERNAQRILGTAIQFNIFTETWDTSAVEYFTNYQDSVAYLWAGQGGNWAWDTLYLFNGLPGARWWPVNAEENCPAPWGMLEIQDTGTTVINGLPLRTWCVAYLDEVGEPAPPGCFEIIERIGSLKGLVPLPSGCIATEGSQELRCYSDVDIPLYETGVAPTCTFMVGMEEMNRRSGIPVYPDPGMDHFVWDPQGRSGQLTLFNGHGQAVLQSVSQGGPVRVEVSGLSAGPYHYRMVDATGHSLAAGTWLKQ